jgi:hypothetical protein
MTANEACSTKLAQVLCRGQYSVYCIEQFLRSLLPCFLDRVLSHRTWRLPHGLLFRFQQVVNLSNQSHQLRRILFLRRQLAQFHPTSFIVPDHSCPLRAQSHSQEPFPKCPRTALLGLILVAALSLHCVRKRHITGSPLGTDHDGKPCCYPSHTLCMFCEGSLQVLKNLIQLGRLGSRRSFVAKLFDPVVESLKHGQRLESRRYRPTNPARVRYSTYCRRFRLGSPQSAAISSLWEERYSRSISCATSRLSFSQYLWRASLKSARILFAASSFSAVAIRVHNSRIFASGVTR